MTKLTILPFAVCLLLISIVAHAQTPQILTTSNSKLPDANLWSIAIDHNGNKWIGTAKSGLVKYDGKDFTTYDKKNSPITENYISSIYVDSKNNVWVPLSGQTPRLAKFDGSAWSVISAKDYPELTGTPYKIKEDNSGKLYFGTKDGIITYDGKTWERLKLADEPIYHYNVLDLDISKTGKIAVGHDNGLLLYDGQNWKSLKTDSSELQLPTVRSVKFMDNGALYIGYGGGFGKGGFSILTDGKWKHYNTHNSKLPDQMVRDIEVSKDGEIWMATNDGLLEIDGQNFIPLKFWPGKYHNAIMGIVTENNKTVWVATPYGLVKLN
jgi:ligand-binding sensor domain-containing protein